MTAQVAMGVSTVQNLGGGTAANVRPNLTVFGQCLAETSPNKAHVEVHVGLASSYELLARRKYLNLRTIKLLKCIIEL